MNRIALLTPHLHRFDAVGNDIINMQSILQKCGYETEIFAGNHDRDLKCVSVKRLQSFIRAENDILIYHYTIAYEPGLDFFRNLKCKKILRYHNITPPHFFTPYHDGIANACRVGQEQLNELITTNIDLFIGASRFNNDDLIRRGAANERCFVLPPHHNVNRLIRQEADFRRLRKYSLKKSPDQKNLLMVGRYVPNKGYKNLILCLSEYRRKYNQNTRLILVGRSDPQLKRYYSEIKNLIQEQGLKKDIIFAGEVSDAALKAFYLTADAFILFSEHEGFCVPLIEAMALGVPIIALKRGAIPETAGNGALLMDNFDPKKSAALLHRLLADEDFAFSLIQKGKIQYQNNYTNERLTETLISIIKKL